MPKFVKSKFHILIKIKKLITISLEKSSPGTFSVFAEFKLSELLMVKLCENHPILTSIGEDGADLWSHVDARTCQVIHSTSRAHSNSGHVIDNHTRSP